MWVGALEFTNRLRDFRFVDFCSQPESRAVIILGSRTARFSMSNPAKPWRHVVLLLSLFVFLLALHAKLSAYPQAAPNSQNSSSKLWLSGQKMETRTPVASAIVPIWTSAFFLFVPLLRPLRRSESLFQFTPQVPNTEFDPRQFLRPPPVF